MTQQTKILSLITEIRNAHPEMENIFLWGSCLNLYCILRVVYPEAVAWYNVDHIITEIDGKFYDITGRVSNKGYLKFTEYYNKRRTSRAFTQMYRAAYKIN